MGLFESRHSNYQIWHDCREVTQFAANSCLSFADRDRESPNDLAHHRQKTKFAQQWVSLGYERERQTASLGADQLGQLVERSPSVLLEAVP
jgi:hypothetical protein